MQPISKKILILTAAFGEGHNTAANNISEALKEHPDVITRVADIYAVTHPLMNKLLQKGYVFAINQQPFFGNSFLLLSIVLEVLKRRFLWHAT